MFKLAGYAALAATAIYLVLAGGQGPAGDAVGNAVVGRAEAAGYGVPVTEPDPVVVETTTPPAPTPEAQHADDKPALQSAQTAPVLMPGPRLKRSPEYAWKDGASAQPAAAQAPAAAGLMYVTAGSVNLRAGPSTQDAVVGKLSAGDAVTVTGAEADGWVGVLLSDGATRGYLAAKFLSAEKS